MAKESGHFYASIRPSGATSASDLAFNRKDLNTRFPIAATRR